MSENKLFLSPEEVAKKRERKVQILEDHDTEEIVIPKKEESENDNIKFFKRGSRVQIAFETLGRFSIPERMWFSDYNVDHVNDLTLANEDNLLETIVAILEEIKNEDCEVSIGECTLEEFMEIMIGIKQQFNNPLHDHKWICDCQRGKDDSEVQVNDLKLDLRSLQFRSIEEADEVLRESSLEQFKEMTDETFEEYLKRKYKEDYSGNISDYDRIKEVNSLRIEEPISQNIDGHIYKFRFTRIKDLIKAKTITERQFAGQIKMIQNKKIHGVDIESLKIQKQKELDVINKKKAKETLIATRALSLIEYDGKVLINDDEKISLYRNIPRESLFEYIEFVEKISFGIQDEREFVCPLCGKTDKRWLQRKLDPLEFIPIESSSSNKPQGFKRTNIFVGI